MRNCTRIGILALLVLLCLGLTCAGALADGNGNVPVPTLSFEDYSCDRTIVRGAFTDNESIGLYHKDWVRNYKIKDYDLLQAYWGGEPEWQVEWEGDSHGAQITWGIGTWAGSGARAIDVGVRNDPVEPCTLVFRVTCTWGGESISTLTTLDYQAVAIPENIRLNIPDKAEGLKVNETYALPVTLLPYEISIGESYSDIDSWGYTINCDHWWAWEGDTRVQYITPREAGICNVTISLFIENIYVRKNIVLYVQDENGNVPAPMLAFTDSGAYDWTTDMVAFADDASIRLGHGSWARNYQIANYDVLASMKTGAPNWRVEWVGDDHGAWVSYVIGTWAGSGSRAIDVLIDDQPSTPCTLHYKVTCTWDGETIVGNGTVNFLSAELPTGAVIPDVVELKVNETKAISTRFIPENYAFQGNESTYLNLSGLNWDGWVDGHIQYVTPYEAGTFYGRLYVQSRNVEISKPVVFRVADENGNVPGEIIPIDEAHFPDAAFRAYLQENFGWKQEDNVYYTALANVEEIDLSNAGVTSVQGLAYFPNLRKLYIYQNQLTSLDISANSALEYVYCYKNQLTSLNVGVHSNLHTISCFSNQLTSLDVTKCSGLKNLYCYENLLTSLDVSGNPELQRLWCGHNRLTSLNVSANPVLRDLNCEGMNVTITGLVNPDAYISNEYMLIPKSAGELLSAGVTVYLDMNFWGMTGAQDANGNTAPRLLPVTDDTYYRDPAIDEGAFEDWVSAKYIYETYLAAGMPYENNYAGSYLYVLVSSLDKVAFKLPASLTSIEAEAFSGIAAEIVIVPNGCVSIASGAFANCPNLKVIIIPANCVVAEGACASTVKVTRR